MTNHEKEVLKQLDIDSYVEAYREVFDKITEGFDITPIYTVKEIADLLDISEHTIRYYDKEKMFPFITRDSKNRRLFSKLDAFLGRSINCFRAEGFSLEECRQQNILTLKGDITIPDRAEFFRNKIKETENEIEELKVRLEKLNLKLEYFAGMEKEVLQELEDGTFEDKGRSTLKNCRFFIQKKFYDAGLVDKIEIDI